MRGWEEIAHFDHKEIFVHFIIRKLYKYIILINLLVLHNHYYNIEGLVQNYCNFL